MDTLSGEIIAIVIFVSLLNNGLLLKERICSHRSKFFPLSVDFIVEQLGHQGKQTGSHKSCLSL